MQISQHLNYIIDLLAYLPKISLFIKVGIQILCNPIVPSYSYCSAGSRNVGLICTFEKNKKQ